jgi:hypothetical protein
MLTAELMAKSLSEKSEMTNSINYVLPKVTGFLRGSSRGVLGSSSLE